MITDYIDDFRINHDISEALDLRIGQKVGRWTISSAETVRIKKRNYRDCVCSCGFKGLVAEASLLRGKSLSCGCGRTGNRKY